MLNNIERKAPLWKDFNHLLSDVKINMLFMVLNLITNQLMCFHFDIY